MDIHELQAALEEMQQKKLEAEPFKEKSSEPEEYDITADSDGNAIPRFKKIGKGFYNNEEKT